MSAAHTPGPWFYDDSIEGRVRINTANACVASIPYMDREAIANARLIAAAPDLLEALRLAEAVLAKGRWIQGSSDPESIALWAARAALAKAGAL